ncbi:MAG: DUF2807 domain-containing protein [Clostridiales bacterium]|nr:DUF2807 domain-containing protein [Clostridiales bacterium]
MNNSLILLLSLSISGSLVAIALFALKPLLKNRLRKTWQYYIWIVVLLRLLFPFAPETSLMGSFASIANNQAVYSPDLTLSAGNEDISEITGGAVIADSPDISNNRSVTPSDDDTGTGEAQVLTNVTGGAAALEMLVEFAPYLWIIFLIISLLLFTRKVVQYSCYLKFLHAGQRELDDWAVYEIYDEIRFETKVKKYVPVYVSGNINTPMLVGIFKPCIIMPETQFSDQEYRMIFRHELIHYKRRDILYKWFTQLVVCVHWFNPLIYFIRREIDKNCELACDETVLLLLGTDEKHGYGNALMASLRNGNGLNNVAVSITMSEDGKNLKERLEAIMTFSNISKLKRILSCALALAIITGAFFLGAYYGDTKANAAAADSIPETILISDNSREGSTVVAQGGVESYDFEVGDFTEIRIDAFCNIEYYATPSDTVTLKIQPNFRDYIVVEESDGVLVVRSTRNINWSNQTAPVLTVSMPALKKVTLNGAGGFIAHDIIKTDSFNLVINGAGDGKYKLDVNSLQVDLFGAGDCELSGSANIAKLSLFGAGNLEALSLITREASVNLFGVGDIGINCSEDLKINATGVGSVEYKGSPSVDINKGKMVSVRKLD